jgi:hypothetical protein
VNIEATDNQRSTPLHYAATNGSEHAVASLIKHGANVNARDMFLRKPIYYAKHDPYVGHLDINAIIEMLQTGKSIILEK